MNLIKIHMIRIPKIKLKFLTLKRKKMEIKVKNFPFKKHLRCSISLIKLALDSTVFARIKTC